MSGGSAGYAAAFGGGFISFLSPCVLPIVPAYLSVITGLDVAEVTGGSRRHLLRVGRDTALFVAGFSSVFIALGLTATTLGRVLFANHVLLTRVSGVTVLAMALFVMGSLVVRAPWLYSEHRFHPSPSRFGPFAAPVAGAAFGFGWTPCIGPVLGSVLAVAATEGHPGRGASLLAAYSLGLGVPFIGAGLAFSRLTGAFGWVKLHFTGLTISSSAVLAVFGVLLTLDRLTEVTSELQMTLRALGLARLVNLG